MEITCLEIVPLVNPYVSRQKISKSFEMKEQTVAERTKEIAKEVDRGTYPSLSIIDDGGHTKMVNYYVWCHYLSNRSKLRDENLRQYVVPFDVKKIQEEFPLLNNIKEVSIKNATKEEFEKS
jgi:DNA/RNA endonuclease G (NUC1)